METPVIQIGNAKCIRLPKTLLKKKNTTLLTPFNLFSKGLHNYQTRKKTEKGMGENFKKMHENGDDKLLIATVFEDENLTD